MTRMALGLKLAVAMLALAGCRAAPPPVVAPAPAPLTYEVLRIIDGDTLVVRDAGGIQTHIRLRRLNAPEMDEPGGPEAKAALAERFPPGSRVRLEVHARDRYGRTIANVSAAEIPADRIHP